MDNLLSIIKSHFPNRDVCSIYYPSSKLDVVVVEDWTFFQFSPQSKFRTIVLVTSTEDYIEWHRMLCSSSYTNGELYILVNNLAEQDNNNKVKDLIAQDESRGIKFLSL